MSTKILLALPVVALLLCRAHEGAAAPPTQIELEPDLSLCETSSPRALTARGLEQTTLFIVGKTGPGVMCFEAALDLAVAALLALVRPPDLARDCDARCWFDRESAAIAGPELADTLWPQPPIPARRRDWLFFATSPDMSSEWFWIVVEDSLDSNGHARVRLWLERE